MVDYGGGAGGHPKQKLFIGAVLAAGLVIGGAAGYIGSQQQGISAQEAGEKVASTLEDSTGQSYEVVNVEEDSGMYRVQLNSNGQLQTYYVSEDGRLLSGSMTDLDQVRQTQQTRDEVNTCLMEKDAVMYGNLSQRPTALQIQILGGPDAVSDYYSDVNNPQNLQEAAQRGVTSVPAIHVSNRTLTNVNNLERIQEFANCQSGSE